MIWYVGTFLFVVIFMAISFASAYVINQRIIGSEATRKQYRPLAPYILLASVLGGAALAFLTPRLISVKYGFQSFCILFTIVMFAFVLNSIFRKEDAGALLLDIGRVQQTKFLFNVGIFQVIYALLQFWLIFSDGIPPQPRLERGLPIVALYWSLAAYSLVMGLSRVEFREKGICFTRYGLTQWQKVQSFRWEPLRSNVLTLKLQPQSSSGSQRSTSIPIPERHREAVSQILSDYVSERTS